MRAAGSPRRQWETTGFETLLPSPVDIDPEAQDDSTVKELDAVVQRFEVGGVIDESMVVQLQTLARVATW